MKKRFTILTAAIALLAILAIPMGMKGQTRENYQGTFTRISSASDFVTGYYVVTPSRSASTTNKALGNYVDGNKRITGVNVTISNNQIINPVNTIVYYITVSTSGNSTTCTFQNVNTGKYMYQASTTSGKGMGFSDDATDITLAGYNTDSPIGFRFTLNGTSNNFFKWNNGNSWYANYANDYTTSMTPVELFKLESTPSTDPVLSVEPSSIDFGSKAINPTEPYEMSFAVTFANLTQDLSVSVGSGLTGVSVSPTTILKTAESPATVTVSYNPEAEGTLSGNITVSNTADNLSETVSVTGSAYDPANISYYEKVTSALSNWSGDYIFTGINSSNYYALTGISSNLGTAASVTVTADGIVSNSTTDGYKVTIAPTSNGYSLYLAGAGYLYYSGNSNQLLATETFSASTCEWTISFEDEVATISNVGSNTRILQFNYNNGNPRFACYTSSQVKLTLFKYANANQVATPTFNPAAGTYTSAQNVTLACATEGATIQYKLTENGTWQNYSAAIPVSETTTIWAKATKTNMEDSPVVSATYTISLPAVETPTFSPAGGNYYSAQNVTLACATSGSTIYYTTDGSDPTTSSSVYSNPIAVNTTTTIKAIAAASGYTNSAVASATYSILEPVFNQDWEGATNGWTFVNVSGDQVWNVAVYSSNHYAKMSGYASNANHANEDWCISPAFDLGDYTNPVLTFTTARSQHNGNVLKVYFSNNYNGDPTTATWTELSCTLPEQPSSGYSEFVSSGDIDLSSYSGTNCYIGFKYTSTDEAAATWELDNIALTSTNIPVINASDVNIAYNATSGSITYSIDNEPTPAGTLTASTTASWLTIGTVTSTTVPFTCTANNDATNRTATVTLTYTYGSNQTATKTVTVTQAVYTPTPTGDAYVRISKLSQLTDGCIVVIAARYDEDHTTGYYAMPNTASGKPTGVAFTSETSNGNEVLPATIVNDLTDYYWVVNVTSDGYTFTNANNQMIGYPSSGTDFSTGSSAHTTWTIERSTSAETAMVGEYTGFVIKNGNTKTRAFAFNGTAFGAYATSNIAGSGYNFFLDFFVESFTLDINGWQTSNGTKHDYYLIASPLAGETAPADVTNMTSGTFQLFSFDPTNNTEWQSYAQHPNDIKLKPGQGYLYTHSDDVTLTFIGAANINGQVTLVKDDDNETQGSWNLVGNSLLTAANIFDGNGDNKTYYRMKSASGSELIIGTGTVAPMEGVFVYANTDGEVITFSAANAKENQQLAFNITQGRSEAIDRAIVRFDEGQELPKFQIDPSHTKLYIPQSEDNYAVVRAAADGVMPLNFKAQTNGNYTISINVENVELNTLVLIDNLTGNEVNLLSRAEYSFDATTDDDENRFTLVYSKSGETKTYKLTITADDFNTTSYAANNTEKTSNAVNVDDPTDTFEVVWTSNQVMKNASGQMQWQKGNGRIYNITNMGSITDVTVDGISGGFTTYYGESIEPAWSGITGQPFFQTKTYDDAVGYSTSLEVTFDIEEGAATTYSVTFDAGEGTFVGNEDFPNTENTKAAGIYTLPDATREGYVFNGWLATGTTTPRTGSYTVYTDVEFTAQYTENGASGGNGGTDVLDLEFTGVSGTNYTSWSDKEGESGAVYAGNSAGGNSAIQLRSSNNNSGIITTASGGMISKVVVTWNENTSNGRVLNVYGKNTAYTAVTDLYNSSKQGTLLGTITCGTSTELLVSDEYTFIGLRSNSGAMYIDEISITWVLPSNVATPTFSPAAGTYMGTQTVTISCETDDAVIYYTTDGTTPDNTSTLYDGGITVSQTTTIQAIAYVDDEASHVATATYTIVVPQTIAEVREQGTGTVLTYGVVTAVSTNSNGTTAYMQDMTAAIVVYGDFTAEVGDEIQVSGTLTTFRGLLEIGTPTVTVASQNNVIDPTVMTIAEIIEDAEGDNEYQAMLVSIVEATVTEINGNNTIIAQGENTITVYGSLGDVEEDDVISFTGNIGCYNTVQIVNPTNIEIQGNTTMPTFFIDGDWFDGANWTTGEVPAAGSNVTIAANATVNDGYIAVVNEMNITSEGSLTIADGGQVKSNTSFLANLQKNITGYGNGTGKYYLITVPASVDMCSVDGFMPMDNTLHTQVDFYAFDQQHEGEEWLNYKYGYDYFAGPYVTHRGVGYLYANKNNTTLNFASVGYSVPQGSTVNYYESPFQPTNVDFNAEIDYNSGVVFAGYNLLGNPFTCNAYLVGNYQFYRMNPDGDAIIAANPGDEIKPGEGIFVVVSSVDDEIIFTAEEPVLNKSCLAINLSDGQSLKDRAIVRFDEDRNIGKFMFNENGAKLYITQDGKDCSVVGSEGIGEMPVNFKAAQNGTYTLSFSNDNVEFSYLHLIDNMTGAEVDLLANPSYSFEAKSSDYASRFKLVFVVNEDNLNNNDNFAFVSNGNIVINGEGTLQVIDMTGRIVSVEEVNGMSSVNVNAAGVYVLQLTNGESVKTQKIVVK